MSSRALRNLRRGAQAKPILRQDSDREDVLMRRVRYVVAASLDGYIAGPNGEADWIIMDPDIDFSAIFNEFDTILVGRRTFEGMVRAGKVLMPGMRTFVFSRTLHEPDHPKVTVIA